MSDNDDNKDDAAPGFARPDPKTAKSTESATEPVITAEPSGTKSTAAAELAIAKTAIAESANAKSEPVVTAEPSAAKSTAAEPATPVVTTPAESTAKSATSEPPKPRKVGTVSKSKYSDNDMFDDVGRWLAKHGALPALAIVTIAVAAIHWHILGGEPAGDDLSFHFAESARIADCLRHFDLDLWNPSANAGYASAYYYQVLPQLVSAVPAAIFGHHPFFFSLSVILPLVFAPIAAYRGMRLMGATPWQATVAAFVIAFMNGESRWGAGNAGTFQVGLYTQTWALCIFPLALGHGARWIRDGKGLAPAIAWGGAAFLCHPFAGISLGVAFVIAFLVQLRVDVAAVALADDARPVAALLERRPVRGARRLDASRHVGRRCRARCSRSSPRSVRSAPACSSTTAAESECGAIRASCRSVDELHRLAILGVTLMLTTAPVLLPLVIDREGFGGFPHRVSDEIGPGFGGLCHWYVNGSIIDFMPKDLGRRLPLLTFGLIPILAYTLIRPQKVMRWLWPPAHPLRRLARPRPARRQDRRRPHPRGARARCDADRDRSRDRCRRRDARPIPVGRAVGLLVRESARSQAPTTRRHLRSRLRDPYDARRGRRIGGRVHRVSRQQSLARAHPHAARLHGARRDDAGRQAPRRATARSSSTRSRRREPLVEPHALHLRARPDHTPDGRRWPASEPELRRAVDRARLREERVDLRRAVPRVRALERLEPARKATSSRAPTSTRSESSTRRASCRPRKSSACCRPGIAPATSATCSR